jgi:outer membrane protein insertion porin family
VEPVPEPVQDEARDKINIRYRVEERSTDTANLSAGWSELDRLIGSIGLGMNNLFGNGQRLSIDWNFGRYYRAFSLSFTEPWLMNTPTLVGASIYDTKRDPFYIGYSQRSRGISFRIGRRFNWPDNYFRGDWIYRLDETELGDFSSYYQEINPNNIVNEQWPLTSSGITQIIARNSLNHPEFPTTGSRVSLTTELTGGLFGGNVGYIKNWFSAEFFLPTFSEKLVFLTRSQFAFMETLGKKGRIPYLEYFFMGGSGLSRAIPLRGYDDPLAGGRYYSEGGKAMLQTTLELRFPIITNPMAFGILFAEAGNTWQDLKHTDPFDLRRSIGIGARVFMPMVGMIGFDLAYGFDNRDASGRPIGAWKTHFVFGRGF